MDDNDTTKRTVQFFGVPNMIDNDVRYPRDLPLCFMAFMRDQEVEDSEYEEVEDWQFEEIKHLYRIEVIDQSDGVPRVDPDPESLQFIDTQLSLPIPKGPPN